MSSINEALNLVVPARTETVSEIVDKKPVSREVVRLYAYHTPISREVFEANYRVLTAAKSAMDSKGVYYMMGSGPRIATLTLKDEGRKEAADQGENGDGGVQALLGEIKRLTMILAPGASGWEMVPVDVALARGVIDADDWSDTESAIVFFTFHYALSRKATRAQIAMGTASVLKGWSTSSSAMDYAASLPTLTTSDGSAVKVDSSVPS